jgi:hypothetical protein
MKRLLLAFIVTSLTCGLSGCNDEYSGYTTYYPFYRNTDWGKYTAVDDVILHIKAIPDSGAVHIVWEGFGNKHYMEWRIWAEPKDATYNYLHGKSQCEIQDSSNFVCTEDSSDSHYAFVMRHGHIITSNMITRKGKEYSFGDSAISYFASKYLGFSFVDVNQEPPASVKVTLDKSYENGKIDLATAQSTGYALQELAVYLADKKGFKNESAQTEGYSQRVIVDYLNNSPIPNHK